MRQVATVVVATLVLAVPQAAAKGGPPTQLLGFVSNGHGFSFAKLGPLTLKPISRAAPTGTSDASFVAVVSGGGRVAFSLSSAALRFLDFQRMRWEFRIAYPGRPLASLWNSADRLVTVSATGEVIVVNPVKRRLGTIRPLRGTVSTVATTSDHILAVIAPLDGIGAARLAVIDDRGRVRLTALPEIRAGTEMLDNGALFRFQSPALAVNGAGTQAVVIGADGTVAEVSLANLATNTHRLASRTLASARKNANGSARTAQWVGANTIAMTGNDASFDGTPPTGTQRSTLRA